MTTLLSKKQFALSICYAVCVAVLLVLSCTLIVAKQEFSGQQILYKIYDSWALIIAAAPLALGVATVFAFIGKKTPFLLFNLLYLCINTICIVSSFMYCEVQVGLFIFIAALVLMMLVVILQLFSKFQTSYIKIAHSKKDVGFNVGFSISLAIVYFLMKAFCIMEISFYPYDDYYASWNFFGTFDKSFVSVSFLEVVFLIIMTLSAVLFWYKKHKIAFSFTMLYTVMFLVVFFYNMNYPHRTDYFAVVSIAACIPVVLAIIKFKGCIKINSEKKIEELDLLLKEGIITQETYNEKVKVLNTSDK